MDTGAWERIAVFQQAYGDKPRAHRMNDGRVDPEGNFIVGGFNEGDAPEKTAMYRLDPQLGGKKLMWTSLIDTYCTNTIAFDSSRGVMYHRFVVGEYTAATSYYFLLLPVTPSVSCSCVDALKTPSSNLPLSPTVSHCLPLSANPCKFTSQPPPVSSTSMTCL